MKTKTMKKYLVNLSYNASIEVEVYAANVSDAVTIAKEENDVTDEWDVVSSTASTKLVVDEFDEDNEEFEEDEEENWDEADWSAEDSEEDAE
jgi:hypothetical protein